MKSPNPANGNGVAAGVLDAPAIDPDETEPKSTKEDNRIKPDDDEIALDLAASWQGKAAHFYGAWRVLEGGTWVERDSAELRRKIRAELREWRKRRGVQVSQTRIKALASMLEDDLYIDERLLKDASHEQVKYVPFANGLFNLETGCLEPHNPNLYFMHRLDFDYDENAQCPTFNRYLSTSLVHPDGTPDPNLRTLMLQAMGYSMTARTDLKASFWLVGAKDSGKSTFISLLKGLMGELFATIDLTQLGTNRFLLAGLPGKRVVAFTEGNSNTVLPDALYKTLVGGSDEIFTDVKNRDPIAFRPQAKVWWAMNDGQLPRIVDRSGATMRRIIILPFNRSIPESERVQGLEERLMGERSGIFNALLSGYRGVVNGKGFIKVEQSEARKTAYVRENDIESMFADEQCYTGQGAKAQGSVLYQAYRGWCERNGYKPKSHIQVAGEWRRLGYTDTKSNGLMYWHGIQPKETEA